MDKTGGVGGAGGGGGAVVVDDMGENMQCINHPYKNNPGGICGFCLQEKLGKLLSASQANPSFFPSSSSPSFRSDASGVGGNGVSFAGSSSSSSIPSASKKKMKKVVATSNLSNNTNLVLVRSKSSSSGAAHMRRHHQSHHLFDGEEYSPRKGGFWSFLHFSSKSSRDKKNGESKPSVHPTNVRDKCVGVGGGGGEASSSSTTRKGDYGDENESPNSSHASSSSFGRKVARSRSVGCGSRSFSGDLLERISTGFGDCTLRRVESQREAKQSSNKGIGMRGGSRSGCGGGIGEHHHRIKERVKCGGIFGGFSSSSSSSSYWASSSEEINQCNDSRRGVVEIGHHLSSVAPHGRSRNWGWAFASPMRVFKSSKQEDRNATTGNSSSSANNANAATTPNLAAIPSLLTVSS